MGMALDEPQENEKPVQINGVGVLISKDDMPYVDGTIVDYVTQSYSGGFTITGPRGSY
jgi:Fe-S cluster assembly iron-binding protein IscA